MQTQFHEGRNGVCVISSRCTESSAMLAWHTRVKLSGDDDDGYDDGDDDESSKRPILFK